MARDNIELVDRDYSQCSKKAMPRQIRTRDSSFRSILKEFRRVLYENKINKVIDKTLSSTYTEENIGDKLMISSERIAALDNKIRRLSKDDIPTKYVKRRAIKLRNYMMENTLKNAAGFYMVDLNKDEVVDLYNSLDDNIVSDVNDDDDIKTSESTSASQIDLSTNEIDAESIRDVIDEEFNSLENDDKSTTFVSPEEVSKVVGNNLPLAQDNSIDISDSSEDNFEKTELEDNDVLFDVVPEAVETSEEKQDDIMSSVAINNEDVIDDSNQDAVTEIKPENSVEVNDVNSDNKDDEIDINVDDIKNEIDEALRNIKVSKSESSIAKFDKFDENGDIRFKDSYTPMSTDEIVESQEKINSLSDYEEKPYSLPSGSIFDKKISFDNLFVPAKDVCFSFENKKETTDDRDVPIVVSDRKENSVVIDASDTKLEDSDKIEEYTFDVIDNTTNIENEDSSSKNGFTSGHRFDKIEEINRLKDKLLALKKKKSETNNTMAEVQMSAVEVAKRAEDMKKKAAEVNGILESKVAELRSCCESLEKNYDETIREISLIENDIQMNNNFIKYQEGQLDETTRFIDEVDKFISAEAETHSKSK